MSNSLILTLLIIFLIVILKQNSTPHQKVSINYIETGCEGVKFYELSEIRNDSVIALDGYITYEAYDNHRYIYNPINKLIYSIPVNVKGRLINIANNNLIAIENNYELNQFIIHYWDFQMNKYQDSKYTLKDPYTFDIVDVQYFDGSIFIALNNGRIIKIDSGIQILTIPDQLKHYYENDTLIAYNDQLYINVDRDLIYQFNQQEQQFQKPSPSPSIPEDRSIHHESSYLLLDSLGHNYLIGGSFDSLYLRADNKSSIIPLNEPMLLGSFIDAERLIFRKDNKLVLLNIDSLKESKLVDFAPNTLKRFLITYSSTYFLLTDDNKLYEKNDGYSIRNGIARWILGDDGGVLADFKSAFTKSINFTLLFLVLFVVVVVIETRTNKNKG